MSDASLLTLPNPEFTRLVNEAFKSYASLLELSRSPLAGSSLITPALVLDEVAPTPDDRGRALRVLLRWAVGRLAPAPPRYPLGTPRPFDDPTWSDPLWWRYNILRHRYLEPLRPDDLADLQSRGFTDALIALSGIPGPDRLYGERDRAIQEVAAILREQLAGREGDEELRRLAVEEIYQSLEEHAPARGLLGLAATFREVFPRALLLELAAAEHLEAGPALDDLVGRRFLLEGDEGIHLLLPPALQEYVHVRQPQGKQARRHRRVAQFYLERGRPLQAAGHLRAGGRPGEAADLLLEAADGLIEAWQTEELRQALGEFDAQDLAAPQWCQVQILLSDLFRKTGERERALDACRRALKSTEEPAQQARIYHRLGKLYEDHNQLHALGYYQRAAERFPPDAPELVELLTDRAWLYIHRREWGQAQMDLDRAMQLAAPAAWQQRAAIHDALASLHRQQEQYEQAISFAQEALFLREERGDRQQVADSYNNLGSIYAEMGEIEHALQSFREAWDIFHKLDNREAMATAQLNIGGTLYYAGRFPEAIAHYQESRRIFQQIGRPRGEAQAHYNLAEALAEVGQVEEARRHWQEGYRLSQQAGLDDQLPWFEQLRQDTPTLQDLEVTAPAEARPAEHPSRPGAPDLLPEEQIALELARRHGRVTARMLLEEAHVSKATATRRLAGLAQRGLLLQVGKGRGTCYVIPGGS